MSGAVSILAGAGPRYSGPYRCEHPSRWSLPRCERCPLVADGLSDTDCPAPLTRREQQQRAALRRRAAEARSALAQPLAAALAAELGRLDEAHARVSSAAAALVERVGLRSAARLVGVSHPQLLQWARGRTPGRAAARSARRSIAEHAMPPSTAPAPEAHAARVSLGPPPR